VVQLHRVGQAGRPGGRPSRARGQPEEGNGGPNLWAVPEQIGESFFLFKLRDSLLALSRRFFLKSTSKAVLDHPDHFLLIINDEYFLSHGHARYC
jgi:hypothetical protein